MVRLPIDGRLALRESPDLRRGYTVRGVLASRWRLPKVACPPVSGGICKHLRGNFTFWHLETGIYDCREIGTVLSNL